MPKMAISPDEGNSKLEACLNGKQFPSFQISILPANVVSLVLHLLLFHGHQLILVTWKTTYLSVAVTTHDSCSARTLELSITKAKCPKLRESCT